MGEVHYGIRGIEDIIVDVLDYGVEIPNERTGSKTKVIFDSKIVIPETEFPFTTNLLASPRLAFEEMWFFLNGKTDTKELEEKGVNFWKGNTSREFLDARGLTHLPEGDLGTAYSKQWRDFGGDSDSEWGRVHGRVGEDQLANLYYDLLIDKYSRRHYVTLWNPVENSSGVLTPCWHSVQFVVLPDRHGNDVLNLKLLNRSLDIVFGARFAIMQYRMLQMAFCKLFGFSLGTLSCDLSHIHIYENQYEYAKELICREYSKEEDSNYIVLNKDLSTLEDLLSIEWSDWEMSYSWNKEKFINKRPEMVA